MTVMIHACEPSLDELKKIQNKLFTEESTTENVKRLEAIGVQIARHERAAEEKKAEEQAKKDAEERLKAAEAEREKKAEEAERAERERRSKWHRGGARDARRRSDGK